MSSATANSAARKRRAGKQQEISKTASQYPQPQKRVEYNNYYSNEDSMKPIINSKDAIYLINNRLMMVETVLRNISLSKENENVKLTEVLEKIEKIEKKLEDTIISTGVKNNILETEILSAKENINELLEYNKSTSKVFDKIQSLVVYEGDVDGDDDNVLTVENSVVSENLNVEILH